MRRAITLLLSVALCAAPAAARNPRPPTGTLTLPIADPVVTVRVAGVPLRLRVGPDAKDVVELNAAATTRLPVQWGPGFVADVGRVAIPGRAVAAKLEIDGRTEPVQVSTHERDCCADVDGEIAPWLLPFARVVLADGPPTAAAETVYPRQGDEATGWGISDGGVLVLLSLTAERSVATAAAGSSLVARAGGRFTGDYHDAPAPFGLVRPVRTLAFDRPVTLAGFAFAALPVRVADFRGRRPLPSDPARVGDIVVRGRSSTQHAWAAVSIGRDRLAGCQSMRFDRIAATIALRCAGRTPA